jgi:hypothetical protein
MKRFSFACFHGAPVAPMTVHQGITKRRNLFVWAPGFSSTLSGMRRKLIDLNQF